MFKMILRIEFIDTETTTMYKKLRCERHRYIFNGILKLEVTFNIICYVCYHLLTGRCEDQCEDIFLPV